MAQFIGREIRAKGQGLSDVQAAPYWETLGPQTGAVTPDVQQKFWDQLGTAWDYSHGQAGGGFGQIAGAAPSTYAAPSADQLAAVTPEQHAALNSPTWWSGLGNQQGAVDPTGLGLTPDQIAALGLGPRGGYGF